MTPTCRAHIRRSSATLATLGLACVAPGMLSGLRAAEERVRVELVQVAVTVVDRAGEPVTDLQATDFVLTEDGRSMKIAVFEAARPLTAGSEAAAELPDTIAEGDPEPAGPIPRPSEPGRRYVVVFDGYNNPSGLRFHAAKKATLAFAREKLRPADQMAVVDLRPQMRVLTDLTSDTARITAALEKAAFLPGGGSGLEKLIESSIIDTASRDGDLATSRLRNLARFNQILDASGQREFYDNLNAIAEGLAQLPGRKYLLLFSGGFPFLRATEQVYGHVDYFPMPFRRMLNQLLRSNTSIYSLNIGDESFGADVQQGGNIRLSLARVGMDENILEHMGLDTAFFGDDPFYTKQTLSVLAEQTGGRFINVPDYERALASIDRELQAAYTLGYYPTNTVQDGRFRKIDVKVRGRSRLEVQHRTGYFAPKPFRAMEPDERRLQLADAAMGRIERDDLPLTTQVGFVPAGNGDTLATLVLDIPLDGLSPDWSAMGDRMHLLDVVLLARDATGRVVDSLSKTVEVRLRAERMPATGGGLRLLESLTFPPGAGELQLVVRDGEGGALTTISRPLEIPSFDGSHLRLSSLHLMTEGDRFAVVDRDFVPAVARERLMREARSRRKDEPIPVSPDEFNPFLLPDGSMFLPTSRRTFEATEQVLVFLQAVNLRYPEEGGEPSLSVTFDFKTSESGRIRLPTAQQPVVLAGNRDLPFTIVYRLDLRGLEPGMYVLRATVLDRLAGSAVQGAESIRIEAGGSPAARSRTGS